MLLTIRLTFIPDISKWKLNDKININNMLRGCKSLKSIPDISKWNINIPQISSNNLIVSKKNSNISE